MATNKRRRICGLDSSQLVVAYQSLSALQNVMNGEDTITEGESEGLVQEHEGHQPSRMNLQTLEQKLSITFLSYLNVKGQIEKRIESSILLGQDQLWSSDTMYRHLATLEMLVPTSGSARPWIDTFFFRASSMFPADRRVVVGTDQTTTQNAGRTNYVAIVSVPGSSAIVLSAFQLPHLRRYTRSGFFLSEGKSGGISLQVSQAVADMYACAKTFQQTILRGALTNGREWIFLIVNLKHDGNGATFKRSTLLTIDVLHSSDSPKINKPMPDLIAAILAYWIEHGFEDITSDDWLEDSGCRD